MKLKVNKIRLGKCPVNKLKPISVLPKDIDVGYGKGQLRPDGYRDIRAESRRFAELVQEINGLSGQKTG